MLVREKEMEPWQQQARVCSQDGTYLKEFIDFGLVQERQPEFFVGYVPLDLLGAVELLDVHVDVLVVEQAADVIHGARLVVLAHNGLLG